LAFAVVRGSNLVIDNCRVFHADSVVDCVIGRRDGDGWSIEPELLTGMITAQLSTTNGIEESCVGSVE
jgi:hypothetical protein